MSDELLPYYHRELAFIRRLGAEFAEAHPKIAGRLRLGPDLAEDPHVERLIEAFAYLNARIRHKLDDDFPEISDALMGVLYPHYQAPIPAMAVVQFALDRGQGELAAGYTVPRHAMLETEPIDGEPCRFRTCYPTTLWPIALTAAGLSGRPFAAPRTIRSAAAQAVLRIGFECFGKGMTFGKLDLDRLRLFIKGQSQHVFGLYELILNNTLGVALAASPTRSASRSCWTGNCLRPVGFGPDEGLLPYSRVVPGIPAADGVFCLSAEVPVLRLWPAWASGVQKAGNQLEVFLYLDRSHVDLEQNVTADTFQLGCTPIVNLYRQRAEPIALTHTETEYRVVPDARRPAAHRGLLDRRG